jgi:hypothetical protein
MDPDPQPQIDPQKCEDSLPDPSGFVLFVHKTLIYIFRWQPKSGIGFLEISYE